MLPYVFAAAVALMAMIVRGMTGFGSSLIMIPLVLMVMEPRVTIPAVAVVESVIGITMLRRAWPHAQRRYVAQLLPLSLLGVLAGSAALAQFDSLLLKRSLGVVIMLFALRQVLALRGPGARAARWPGWLGYVASLASGVLGALFGTAGPPVIIFLENQIDSSAALRGTLIIFFFVFDVVRLGGYAFSGLLPADPLLLGAAMLPTALAGNWIGTHLHLRMNERLFRAIVGAMLMLAGLLLVVR